MKNCKGKINNFSKLADEIKKKYRKELVNTIVRVLFENKANRGIINILEEMNILIQLLFIAKKI